MSSTRVEERPSFASSEDGRDGAEVEDLISPQVVTISLDSDDALREGYVAAALRWARGLPFHQRPWHVRRGEGHPSDREQTW